MGVSDRLTAANAVDGLFGGLEGGGVAALPPKEPVPPGHLSSAQHAQAALFLPDACTAWLSDDAPSGRLPAARASISGFLVPVLEVLL